MIKLYGFPASNYTNMVHLALLEKGAAFEYVQAFPDQTESTLVRSPRGKVPYLETEHGFLNEASVILEYLEDVGAGTPLLPADPYARAAVRSLMREVELYVELPARSCYVEVFFEGKVAEGIRAKARDDLAAGFATLARHGKFSPYLAGATFTLADIVLLYTVGIANEVYQRVSGRNAFEEYPAIPVLLDRLQQRPHVQAVAKAQEAVMPTFLAAMKAKFKPTAA